MGVVMEYKNAILTAARQLQEAVAGDVEAMTSLNILAVDIQIRSLKRKNAEKMAQQTNAEMAQTAPDAGENLKYERS